MLEQPARPETNTTPASPLNFKNSRLSSIFSIISSNVVIEIERLQRAIPFTPLTYSRAIKILRARQYIRGTQMDLTGVLEYNGALIGITT